MTQFALDDVSLLERTLIREACADPDLQELFDVAPKPCILLVEDSPAEARLAMFGLEEAGVDHHVEWVSTITEARRVLTGAGRRQMRPDLILLDYYLPDGKSTQFLYELKADMNLRRIPVVMLTSSEVEGDVFRAYDHHANSYVAKPTDLAGYAKTMSSVVAFWLQTARLTGF